MCVLFASVNTNIKKGANSQNFVWQQLHEAQASVEMNPIYIYCSVTDVILMFLDVVVQIDHVHLLNFPLSSFQNFNLLSMKNN